MPTDKGARLLSSRATSGRVTQGSDGLLSSCYPLDLNRVEAEHLHVRQRALPR